MPAWVKRLQKELGIVEISAIVALLVFLTGMFFFVIVPRLGTGNATAEREGGLAGMAHFTPDILQYRENGETAVGSSAAATLELERVARKLSYGAMDAPACAVLFQRTADGSDPINSVGVAGNAAATTCEALPDADGTSFVTAATSRAIQVLCAAGSSNCRPPLTDFSLVIGYPSTGSISAQMDARALFPARAAGTFPSGTTPDDSGVCQNYGFCNSGGNGS